MEGRYNMVQSIQLGCCRWNSKIPLMRKMSMSLIFFCLLLPHWLTLFALHCWQCKALGRPA